MVWFGNIQTSLSRKLSARRDAAAAVTPTYFKSLDSVSEAQQDSETFVLFF